MTPPAADFLPGGTWPSSLSSLQAGLLAGGVATRLGDLQVLGRDRHDLDDERLLRELVIETERMFLPLTDLVFLPLT